MAIEITRHEKEGILQGFSFWAYPDPIIILVHMNGMWYSKTQYYGWGSFGAINQNVEVTGFETLQQADDYITQNNLIFAGDHMFYGDGDVTIFKTNIDSETSPVLIADNQITQPGEANVIFGTEQNVINWIMEEDFDFSSVVLWDDLIGQEVKKGKLCQKDAVLYICIGRHIVLANWLPSISVSLWTKYLPTGVIGDWRPPEGSHDAYPIGSRVRHVGWIWEATEGDGAGLNVWEPGVFGWTQVQEIQPDNPDEPGNPCDEILVWDANELYTNMAVGDERKREVAGVWKVYEVKNLGFVHYDPAGPNGHYGWEFQYDCE